MALKKYEETDVANIAKTIRSKTGTDTTYNISEMAGGVEEVFEAGRNDVLCNSKYIPKSATGKVISLTDVSEVAHKVKVKGDGQEVEVYGKNLLPYPYEKTTITSGAITFTVNADSSVSAVGTSTAIANFQMATKLPMKGGKTYTFSTGSANVTVLLTYKKGNGSTYYLPATSAHASMTWEDDFELVSFGVRVLSGVTVNETIYPIIVEGSNYDGKWEPYTHQTITATPNGTEIDSMCPNMNFFADADITVDYYSSFGMAEKELAMWNALTNYGARYSYSRAFAYTDYTGYTIPSGLCRPTKVIGDMFYCYHGTELPRGIDCSGFDVSSTLTSYHCNNTFAYSTNLTHIYDMGIPANKTYTGVCINCKALKSIEIIRCSEESIFDNNSFNGCSALTHVIFSGVIASDINLQWSKNLDTESLVSLAVTLAHLITTECNPEGTNVPEGLQFTLTVTLSPESWAILENTPYPGIDSSISCADFITSAKGWLRA